MHLLHFATLQPQGPSSLAAIRFSAPVKVEVLRIFPPGRQLFRNDETVLSETQYLESHEEAVVEMRLFFTAAPTQPPGEGEKPKPSNQLAQTIIHYDGGVQDFKIDMGDYSTRLMMLGTWIPKVTIAVYGHVISDSESPAIDAGLPAEETFTSTPLPKYLDLTRVSDPTSLAKQLCLECVGSIPILHLLRLMFLLKPSDSDWELPNYPAKYADLENLPKLPQLAHGELSTVNPKQGWLEQIMGELRFPISDTETLDNIRSLAGSLSTVLNSPGEIKPAWLIHSIMTINKQPSPVAKTVFAQVNLIEIISTDAHGSGGFLERLLACASNPYFAEHLCQPATMQALKQLRDRDQSQGTSLIAALIDRAEGWPLFVHGLTTVEADFAPSVAWIHSILGDEDSFAIFIQGLVSYEPVAEVMSNGPTKAAVLPLFSHCPGSISINERLAFVKAIVGLGCLLPIFCWANSEGKQHTLQRVIRSFLLWQDDPGYREVLNRLLSLKQCIWRLLMTVKDCAQGTSIGAESLLYRIYRSVPRTIFQPIFADYLKTRTEAWLPLSDSIWFPKTISVAERGLAGVLQLLLTDSTFQDGMEDPDAVYLLRVLVEALDYEVEQGQEERIFESILEASPQVQGLVPALVDHLMRVATSLQRSSTSATSAFHDEELHDLLLLSHSLLKLISHFSSIFPPLFRVVDGLATSLVQIQVARNLISLKTTIMSQLPNFYLARAGEAVISMIDSFSKDSFGPSPSDRIFEVLLTRSLYPSGPFFHSEFEQISVLLDRLILSEENGSGIRWRHRVIGQLPLVQEFLCRNDSHARAIWIKRLIDLDSNESGLEESLLIHEVTQLHLALERLQDNSQQPFDTAFQFQIVSSFDCLEELTQYKSVVEALMSGKISERLAICYSIMSRLRIHIDSSTALARQLLASDSRHLRVGSICALLREARSRGELPASDILTALNTNGSLSRKDVDLLSAEIGSTLSVVSSQSSLSASTAQSLIAWLEWLSNHLKDAPLMTLSYGSFQSLQNLGQAALGAEVRNTLVALGNELHFGDEDTMEDDNMVLHVVKSPLTPAQMASLLETHDRPRTPPARALHPALGLVTTSPTNSVTRSPMGSTLTKTYLNNDFRQLRSSAITRLNTSRPPSTHVDEFTIGSPLGTRSAPSQASAQSSPAMTQAQFTGFIPGLQ